jgi:DNA end-binding protein Ku
MLPALPSGQHTLRGVFVPSSVWKGSIVLSLISIPVQLFAAARSERTYLHQIHKDCNSRVKQPLFCPTCNRFVDRTEIIKGFEFDEGQYVLMDDKEIKKLAAASSHSLEILTFSKLSEIDPIFFDSSYFCVPDEPGRKAYQLLVKALEDTRTVGIGKLMMHQRDYTVFLRSYQHGLLLHTMYFSNEIRQLPQFGVVETVSLKPEEVKLTEQLVKTMSHPFKPKEYHNEFQDKLRKLLEDKKQGKTVEIGEESHRAAIIDMTTALQRSLAASSSGSRDKKKSDGKARKPGKRSAKQASDP